MHCVSLFVRQIFEVMRVKLNRLCASRPVLRNLVMFPRDSIHLTALSRLRHPVVLPIVESCGGMLYLLSLDQPNRMRYFSHVNVELFKDGQGRRWLCILVTFYVFSVNRNGQGSSNPHHGQDKVKVCMAWLRIEPRFK